MDMPNQTFIEVIINDLPEKIPAGLSVQALLTHLEERDPHVIIELNGRYVYAKDYATTLLNPGDQIELINPDFGG